MRTNAWPREVVPHRSMRAREKVATRASTSKACVLTDETHETRIATMHHQQCKMLGLGPSQLLSRYKQAGYTRTVPRMLRPPAAKRTLGSSLRLRAGSNFTIASVDQSSAQPILPPVFSVLSRPLGALSLLTRCQTRSRLRISFALTM